MINNAIMEALQVYYVIGRSKSLRLTFSNLILEYVIFSKRLKFTRGEKCAVNPPSNLILGLLTCIVASIISFRIIRITTNKKNERRGNRKKIYFISVVIRQFDEKVKRL